MHKKKCLTTFCGSVNLEGLMFETSVLRPGRLTEREREFKEKEKRFGLSVGYYSKELEKEEIEKNFGINNLCKHL